MAFPQDRSKSNSYNKNDKSKDAFADLGSIMPLAAAQKPLSSLRPQKEALETQAAKKLSQLPTPSISNSVNYFPSAARINLQPNTSFAQSSPKIDHNIQLNASQSQKLPLNTILSQPQEQAQGSTLEHDTSQWDRFEYLDGLPSKKSADVFDVDLFGHNQSTPSVEDDILGLLALPVSVVKSKGQGVQATMANVNMKFEMEQLEGMGFDPKSASAALLDNNMDIQLAINSLISNGSSKKKQPNLHDEKLKELVSQLVAMGFDPQESKSALLANSMDTQKSIDMMFNESSEVISNSESDEVQQLMRMGFIASQCRKALKASNGDLEKAIELLIRSKQGRRVSFSESEKNDKEGKLKPQQTDNYVEAASQIGMTVFMNAKNAFSLSKKTVEKVINEITSTSTRGPTPKASEITELNWSKSTFRDAQISNPSMGSEVQETEHKDLNEKTANLLADYIDPAFDMAGVKKSLALVPLSDKQIIQPMRKISVSIEGSQPQLELSTALRAVGNTYFKKGQFGDAYIEYTKAIEALPVGHLARLPLYNNRAACSLKNGDNRGAIADCDIILGHDPQDIKALLRRATGFESLENWDKARSDYKSIMELDQNVKGCSLGLARANAALKPKQITILSGALKPIDVSLIRAAEEAVKKLRNSNEISEKLESEKFACSESVNIRVSLHYS